MNFLKLSALVLIISFSIYGCQENKQPENNSNYNENNTSAAAYSGISKAPNFVIKGVDGKDINLAKYKGKIVILDFWATWCPPCRKGIPDLIELQDEFKKDLVVIGVSVDTDTKNEVAGFMKSQKINYPVGFFTDKVVKDYGGIEAIPTSFIIDKKGNIIQKFVGLVEKQTYVDYLKKLK